MKIIIIKLDSYYNNDYLCNIINQLKYKNENNIF